MVSLPLFHKEKGERGKAKEKIHSDAHRFIFSFHLSPFTFFRFSFHLTPFFVSRSPFVASCNRLMTFCRTFLQHEMLSLLGASQAALLIVAAL
jgi:hypothetical protein